MTEHSDSSGGEQAVTLSAADAAALDSLLARGQPAIKLQAAGDVPDAAGEQTAIDPVRLARVQAWLKIAGAAPVAAASADLLERTLAGVQADRMSLQNARAHSASTPAASRAQEKPPRRWSHVGEIAAMLVAAALLVTVLIPAIGQARMSYRRTLCATNLAAVGTALNLYAAANNHELPSLATPAHGNWLNPEAGGHTNTANLLPLVNAYIAPQRLICAGRGLPDNAAAVPTANDLQNCSYSYLNLFGPQRPTWNNSSGTIVLADRNPLFTAPGVRSADENSFNHGQKGSYVLRADGHASWEISPNIGPANDNIWTLGSGSNRVMHYAGTEVASSSSDVFLAP